MSKKIDFASLAMKYNSANSRLILLDYDGTLVPFKNHPSMVEPDEVLKRLLREFASDPRNHVMLISGRDRDSLDDLLGDTPIVLTAEHGGYYKNPGGAWSQMFPNPVDWVPKTYPALVALAHRFKGSHIERKSFSLAWHYRLIADRVSEADKHDILSEISSLPTHQEFQIYDGDFTIELRTPIINKGSFVSRWIGSRHYDFVLAMGDSKTDEDLFKIFGEDAFTIKVGTSEPTVASFHLRGQPEVLPLLQRLSESPGQFAFHMSRASLRA